MMDDDDRKIFENYEKFHVLLFELIGIIFVAFLLSLVFSCKSSTKIVEVPVETIKHDSIYIARDRVDSVIVKDSVYIKESNDTVFQNVYKFIEKIKQSHDTIYIARADTLTNVVAIEKEVGKPYVPVFFKILSIIGGIAIALAVVWLVIWIKRRR